MVHIIKASQSSVVSCQLLVVSSALRLVKLPDCSWDEAGWMSQTELRGWWGTSSPPLWGQDWSCAAALLWWALLMPVLMLMSVTFSSDLGVYTVFSVRTGLPSSQRNISRSNSLRISTFNESISSNCSWFSIIVHISKLYGNFPWMEF